MPTTLSDSATAIVDIPVEAIRPNGYNPNRMSPGMLEVLAKTMRRDGLLGVILVNRRAGNFIIIDGEHRWLAAKRLGMKTVPCFVVDVPEDRAKALTVKLNQIHGTWNGEDLIHLLRSLPDPLDELGFSEYQHKKQLEELAVKDGLKDVMDEVERQLRTTVAGCATQSELYVGFLLSAEQRKLLEQALAHAVRVTGDGTLTRSESLEVILRRFIMSLRTPSSKRMKDAASVR